MIRPAPSKVIKAKHSKGILIFSEGEPYFRVQHGNTFTDFAIHHSDLTIEIVDEDSCFYYYGKEKEPVLDHSPATLGNYDITVLAGAHGDGLLSSIKRMIRFLKK